MKKCIMIIIALIYSFLGVQMLFADTTPNHFKFINQKNVALSTPITSNTITVSGIDTPAPISIVGGTYSINGGSYTGASGTVMNGDTVTVQVMSAASFSTVTMTTLTIGGVKGTFSVKTLAADTKPDKFTFIPQTGAPLNTVVTSNTITVSGINTAAPISIVGGTYKINSEEYTSASGTVSDGDTVTVRQTSAGRYSKKTTATLTIGKVKGAFSVTTRAASRAEPLKNAGLYVQFEQRGFPNGYWSGDIILKFNDFDSVVNSLVSAEVSLQLDKMKAMGVNTITIELRTADNTTNPRQYPPYCEVHRALGFLFPQPTATELANLTSFFDMVQNKGMKVWLRLVNSHMEQQPPTNSQMWLGAILGAIGNHPALDLVLFEGTPLVNTDSNTCGITAEPPLWLGPGSVPATYVQWAIGFAMSPGMGIPTRKLSAEAVIGDFFLESMPPAGPTATNHHLWSPIVVEKMIFDNLDIPASDRAYALSFYEHRKCSTARGLTCTDLNPHDWADKTLQYVAKVVGSSPRIVAPEMGDMTPVDQVNWITQHAVESIVFLMQKYGIDGGSFWRWVSFQDSEDSDTNLADPVKIRGVLFTYSPVQKEIVDMGGFHVPWVPNGSFEGAVVNGIPANWTAAGNGTVSQYLLTQPEVPSRGTHAMRIITGAGSNDSITATSMMIPVIAATTYTTTANMRFAWTGDPNPGGLPASRPQVFVNILYFQANGNPSAVSTKDSFPFFQEDSTTGTEFATFPEQYTTPSDAAFVEIQFGAMRNGLPTQITLDVDNVR